MMVLVTWEMAAAGEGRSSVLAELLQTFLPRSSRALHVLQLGKQVAERSCESDRFNGSSRDALHCRMGTFLRRGSETSSMQHWPMTLATF